VALVTNTIVSFTPRTSTRPNTIVSFSGRPLVTSIDVGIDGRAGRQPAALVTNTGVSFTLRTSPPFPAALQAIAAGPIVSRWPLVTSMIVSFRPRTLDQAEHGRQPTAAPSTSAVAPGDEHRRHQAGPVVSRRPW
jgi:hypothetical protein